MIKTIVLVERVKQLGYSIVENKIININNVFGMIYIYILYNITIIIINYV